MAKTKINSIADLRVDLAKTYEELREGTIKCADAKAIANLAGKMINSAKVQIEYNTLRARDTKIDFLEC